MIEHLKEWASSNDFDKVRTDHLQAALSPTQLLPVRAHALLRERLVRGASSYAVRQMMEFIEQVVERQTSVAEYEWTAWCCRLQQTLMLLADSEGGKIFRELGLNPLSPLKVPSFRPAFAESNHQPASKTYEALLHSIAQKWGVDDLLAIGVTS